MPRGDWKSTWDVEARAEYRDFMHDVCNASPDTGRRRNALLDRLPGLLQSNRYWVSDLERRLLYLGALEVVREFARAERTRPVLIPGSGASKSGVLSVKVKSAAGEIWNQLAAFEIITFEQIAVKRREYLKAARSYNENVAFLDRLLALHEMAPGATSPSGACEELGISIDEYLMTPMAEAA